MTTTPNPSQERTSPPHQKAIRFACGSTELNRIGLVQRQASADADGPWIFVRFHCACCGEDTLVTNEDPEKCDTLFEA
jgi:hypothetical protein